MKKNKGNNKEVSATSAKKDGITSAFSAATEESRGPGQEGREKGQEPSEQEDEVADRINDEPAGNSR